MKPTEQSGSAFQAVLTKDELQAFDRMSKEIIKKVSKWNKDLIEEESGSCQQVADFLYRWLAKVMRKNILGGKMLRGLMVPTAYKTFEASNSRDALPKMQLAYALGWILEILQAASLVADDIMDKSETRRGKPCWYKTANIGLTAINDSFLLEMTAFQVLKIYFEKEPYYRELYDTLHNIIFHTIHGQSLDCHTETSEDQIVDCYTMERYDTIVKYKTSYYTTYMPALCAMVMAGKSSDTELVSQVESIMLQIGHLFQVQDDYLDCFGDEQKTGKVGTDIQDKKCSWLFVKAVELCRPEELEVLLDNYGKHDDTSVEIVKKLYLDVGVKQAYHDYEDKTYYQVAKKLAGLPDDMPRDLFHELLNKVYKRNL